MNFSVVDLISECGFDQSVVKRRTVSRYLNNNGYKYMQARKKGLLSENDRKLRLSYARTVKTTLKSSPDFHTNHVAFYLDGVSFVHKNDPLRVATQPRSRVWRSRRRRPQHHRKRQQRTGRGKTPSCDGRHSFRKRCHIKRGI